MNVLDESIGFEQHHGWVSSPWIDNRTIVAGAGSRCGVEGNEADEAADERILANVREACHGPGLRGIW